MHFYLKSVNNLPNKKDKIYDLAVLIRHKLGDGVMYLPHNLR